MTPASPHQHGCNTAYFYYCTNASDVLSVAAESGKAAAVRFWLETMETNLDIPSRNQGSMRVDLTPLGGPFDSTIRQAIAFRAMSWNASLMHLTVRPSGGLRSCNSLRHGLAAINTTPAQVC